MTYTIRTGDIDTDQVANTHREALLLALLTAPPDAHPGRLAVVKATEGDDQEERYLPTQV